MSSITIDGKTFEVELLDKWAPKTVKAMQAISELDLSFERSSWCGPALHALLDDDRVLAIEEAEQPVISMYPGMICLRPIEKRNSTYKPEIWAKLPDYYNHTAELLLAHDHAEHRNATGPSYVTPFARIRNFTPEVAAHIKAACDTGKSKGRISMTGAN